MIFLSFWFLCGVITTIWLSFKENVELFFIPVPLLCGPLGLLVFGAFWLNERGVPFPNIVITRGRLRRK